MTRSTIDARLLTWARQVKQRRKSKHPVLWLFTDLARQPNPLPAIARLPQGLAGVVFRHDSAANRYALGQQIAHLCRARNLALVVAGNPQLAARLHAGLHLRGGRHPGHTRLPPQTLRTASAHNLAEIHRARRHGAMIIFISPTFATPSHPNIRPLGPQRWVALARAAAPAQAYALGGISGRQMKLLAGFCCGAASITALSGCFNKNVI